MSKEYFINREVWLLSIMGAFQRANIYKEDAPEMDKTYFKRMLKGYLDNLIETSYLNPVSEPEHLENIKAVIRHTESSGSILTKGKLNFGVAQKLLNLYLKYHWCLDKIPIPPHFPVDSIIQKELGLKIVPWTKMKDETDYLTIIEQAKKQLQKYQCKSIAELELLLFSRNL